MLSCIIFITKKISHSTAVFQKLVFIMRRNSSLPPPCRFSEQHTLKGEYSIFINISISQFMRAQKKNYGLSQLGAIPKLIKKRFLKKFRRLSD